MQPTTIIRAIALALTLGATSAAAQTAPDPAPAAEPVQMQHIRNATAKIAYAGQTFLVDPLLARKGAYPGFEGTFHSEQRNPLVDLPMTTEEVMAGVDAVIVTHTHLDHWDGALEKASARRAFLRAGPHPTKRAGAATPSRTDTATRLRYPEL